MKKKRMYFANDLFNEATRDYNEKISKMIEERFGDKLTQYVPQLNDSINNKDFFADAQMVADADYEELCKSDFLLAILDSNDVGVALEIGIMYEQKKPIIGLYTDVRQFGGNNKKKLDMINQIGQNQFAYVNIMETGLILNNGYLVNSVEHVLDAIDVILNEHL